MGLPWQSLIAYLRIVTNPRIFDPPARTSDAWREISSWLAVRAAWIPIPTERHHAVLGALLHDGVNADLLPDAHLAALAIEHGLTLCSTDGDFARFAELRWENPLA